MKKRVLTMLLALVMALGLVVPALAADEFEAEEPAVREEETTPETPEAPVAPEMPGEEPTAPEMPADEPAAAAAGEPEEATAEMPTSGTCGAQGDNLTWALSEDGALTISGVGDMMDYVSVGDLTHPTPPWYEWPVDDSPLPQDRINKIVIEEGVTSIGDLAFYMCWNAISVTIPDTVSSIGSYAFALCESLTSVSIPMGVTTIEESAFSGCSALTDVTIPNSVKNIGDTAFSDCVSLRSLEIPESVFSLGVGLLDQWEEEHQQITLTVRNPLCTFPSVEDNLGRIFAPDNTIIRGYDGSTAEAYAKESGYTFQSLGAAPGKNVSSSGTCGAQGDNLKWELTADGTLSITGTGDMDNYDFSSAHSLRPFPTDVKRIIVGPGVTTIGSNAFWGMNASEVYIGDAVKYIGESAFSMMENLTSITFPSSVTTMGKNTFFGCDNLAEINLSENLTAIPETMAISCKSLRSIVIPGSVQTIGQMAFFGCENLASVEFPLYGSLRSIGTYSFATCNALTALYFPSSLTEIGNDAFVQCLGLKTIDFGKGLRSIGRNASMLCEALESVVIPKNVTDIHDRAFAGCSSMTSITIENPKCSIYYTATASGGVLYSDTLGVKSTVTVYGQSGSTAESFADHYNYRFEATTPSLDNIQPPAGGTGWRYVPETGDYYYFHNYKRVGDYWVGFAEGASKWANNWYYADADGKLLTGFQYLDDLKGGKAWYMLQTTNDRNEIGKMLTGWLYTYTDAGYGEFSAKYGSQGMCTYTQGWGSYNASTGLWGDGLSHRG